MMDWFGALQSLEFKIVILHLLVIFYVCQCLMRMCARSLYYIILLYGQSWRGSMNECNFEFYEICIDMPFLLQLNMKHDWRMAPSSQKQMVLNLLLQMVRMIYKHCAYFM
jgi:hypothetical protein